ncbi:MAG: NirA family protein, partial [Planctomycetales bacterium]|nr:NirA family protein [Planctomycetales bacterium]
EIESLGLEWQASSVRAGLVACTGSAGCKFAGADTKRHAMQIADYVEQRCELDQPINVHLTGCHHSCAQHYIGDIGLIGTAVEDGDDMVEGYAVYVGGGYGDRRQIGRLLHAGLRYDEAPAAVLRLIEAYLQQRFGAEESFAQFVERVDISALQSICSSSVAA